MDYEMAARRLGTIVGIPVTPFDGNGEIDEEAYIRVLDGMAHPNMGVLAPNGNTSEFYALETHEAKRCVEITVAHSGDAQVMAGVGLDTRTAIAAAKDAQCAGADMVMIHQAVHPYRSRQGWIDYHTAIAEAVPEMGMVLYLRDPTLTPALLAQLVNANQNIVGVKYAVPDLGGLSQMIDAVPSERLTWICGLAETWAPFAWLVGAHAYTSGLVNVAPNLSGRMFQNLRVGDFDSAMLIWRQLQPFEQMRNANNGEYNVSVIKEALDQLGVCGRTVRPPISGLTETDIDGVRAFLRSLEPSDIVAGMKDPLVRLAPQTSRKNRSN